MGSVCGKVTLTDLLMSPDLPGWPRPILWVKDPQGSTLVLCFPTSCVTRGKAGPLSEPQVSSVHGETAGVSRGLTEDTQSVLPPSWRMPRMKSSHCDDEEEANGVVFI